MSASHAAVIAIAFALAGSGGLAAADGIFPECEGESCDLGCSNNAGCTGSGASCDARATGASQSASIAGSLALLGLVSYRIGRKRRRR